MLSFESQLWDNGYSVVAGVDEVGRGSLAGPVTVGCVAFSPYIDVPDIRIDDSKKLTQKQRETANSWIKENALFAIVKSSGVDHINTSGIVDGVQSAIKNAVNDARILYDVDHLLLDAFDIGVYGLNERQRTPIIKGDTKSFTIACASIIAKVHRDSLMSRFSEYEEYSVYGWERNKGYATKEHREKIIEHGPCDLHRTQFISKIVR